MFKTDKSASNSRFCLVCHLTFPADLTHCPDDGVPMTFVFDGNVAPDLIPGFRLEDEIGQGSTGKVYRARRLDTAQTVAVKILHLPLLDDLEMVQRFKQEAELTSTLSSKHIVGVSHYGLVSDGRPYMVMDYIEGDCVSSIVDREGPMSPHRALPIFIQVATGLAHVHGHGIMHRDIKLTNIMLVDQDGEHDLAKIVDFGIAKQWQRGAMDGTALTLAGEAIGSPLYMSPEQCRGKAMDHRTDIYSLGSVMYEMLTGRALFRGPDAISIMTQHIGQTPSPMALPLSEISKELEEIVFKALAKDPDDRFADANALKSELQFCHYNLMMGSSAAAPVIRHAA